MEFLYEHIFDVGRHVVAGTNKINSYTVLK